MGNVESRPPVPDSQKKINPPNLVSHADHLLALRRIAVLVYKDFRSDAATNRQQFWLTMRT
jgi:hypothetical protein